MYRQQALRQAKSSPAVQRKQQPVDQCGVSASSPQDYGGRFHHSDSRLLTSGRDEETAREKSPARVAKQWAPRAKFGMPTSSSPSSGEVVDSDSNVCSKRTANRFPATGSLSSDVTRARGQRLAQWPPPPPDPTEDEARYRRKRPDIRVVQPPTDDEGGGAKHSPRSPKVTSSRSAPLFGLDKQPVKQQMSPAPSRRKQQPPPPTTPATSATPSTPATSRVDVKPVLPPRKNANIKDTTTPTSVAGIAAAKFTASTTNTATVKAVSDKKARPKVAPKPVGINGKDDHVNESQEKPKRSKAGLTRNRPGSRFTRKDEVEDTIFLNVKDKPKSKKSKSKSKSKESSVSAKKEACPTASKGACLSPSVRGEDGAASDISDAGSCKSGQVADAVAKWSNIGSQQHDYVRWRKPVNRLLR